jgi:hypothetical protein
VVSLKRVNVCRDGSVAHANDRLAIRRPQGHLVHRVGVRHRAAADPAKRLDEVLWLRPQPLLKGRVAVADVTVAALPLLAVVMPMSVVDEMVGLDQRFSPFRPPPSETSCRPFDDDLLVGLRADDVGEKGVSV